MVVGRLQTPTTSAITKLYLCLAKQDVPNTLSAYSGFEGYPFSLLDGFLADPSKFSRLCYIMNYRPQEGSETAGQLRAPRFTNAQVLHTEGVEYLKRGGSGKLGNSWEGPLGPG